MVVLSLIVKQVLSAYLNQAQIPFLNQPVLSIEG